MFYQRHVLAVNLDFSDRYGFVPVCSPLFVCTNERETDTLRGSYVVPLLLGTDMLNFGDSSIVAEFGSKNQNIAEIMAQYKRNMLTADEIKKKVKGMQWKYSPDLKKQVLKFLHEAETRADVYSLAGKTDMRFVGMTTLQQNPGSFVRHGLIEVQTCVEGVSRWKPYVAPGELPLFQRYACGDPVYAAPPGAYRKVKIGTIVDFLDENEARILLEL